MLPSGRLLWKCGKRSTTNGVTVLVRRDGNDMSCGPIYVDRSHARLELHITGNEGTAMRRFLAASLFSALIGALVLPPSISAADCQFVLGFKTLRDMIPGTVGDCLTDEHHNPDNGDGLQETTGPGGKGGLLVWRNADNWTAFTDGHWTWIRCHGFECE